MPEIKDEFDDIVAQLLEERPQIDPAFARELDERAAAGFPRRRRARSAKWSFPMWVPATGLAAVIAVVIGISAAGTGDGISGDSSAGGSSSSGSVAAVQEEKATADEAAPESFGQAAREGAGQAAPDMGSGSVGASIAPASPPPTGRQRVQELSAALTVEVPADEITSANDKVMVITNQLGGFVESANVRSTDEETGGGTYVLRLPVENLQDGLTQLGRLGHVRERSQAVQDITSERNVARDNLREAKAVRVSLLKRLAEADTDAETAVLRAQLRDVNNQIGIYRGQLRNVERRAAFARVSMTLTAEDKKGAAAGKNDDQWAVGDAFKDAGRVLEVVAGVLVIALAVLIPLLLLALAVVMTRRVLGRRGRERALDAI